MKEIPLTRGKVALVDDEDYERIAKHKWYADSRGYAKRTDTGTKENRYRKLLLMHREIMNPPKDMHIDHINGNTGDNRKENLRVCTRSQNKHNGKAQRNNRFGHRGVSLCYGKWYAKIRMNGKLIYIGHYLTKEEAIKAYNDFEYKMFGEFVHKDRQPKSPLAKGD